MARAQAVGRRAVALSPRNVPQRNNLALYAMYAGDFEGAAGEFRQVLEMNPGFEVALVGLALAQLAQGKVEEAEATYGRLAALGPRGASAAAMGRADIAVYQGRLDDAAETLRPWVERDEAGGDKEAAALKLVLLAEVDLALGQGAGARRALERAVASGRTENVLLPAALVSTDCSSRIGRRIADQLSLGWAGPQHTLTWSGWNCGGRPREAMREFARARGCDTWLGHVELGRAYLELGAFPEAQTEFEAAVNRRGEATAVFLDEVPTYRLFPPVLFYLGRAGVGLKDRAAVESLRAFLAIRGEARLDPLVAETRRLLALPDVGSKPGTAPPANDQPK
jgi:tetratricopeptide (TPR) repeat protein